MNEILINTTERLYLKIYSAGVATNADAEPTVTVYDAAGEILHSNVDVTQESPGVYYVLSSLADSGVEKEVTYVWEFAVNSVETTKIDKVRFVTPYISLQEIRDIQTDVSYEKAIAAEKYARYLINQHVGQEFGKHESTITMHGNGQERLILPERLLELKTVLENGVSVYDYLDAPVGYAVTISDTSYALSLGINSEYGVVISLPTDRGRIFGRESEYIISGVWGWQDVPSEVNMAARLLAEDFLCRRDLAWQAKWVTDVSGENWKFSFNDRQFVGTGNSIADRILSPFTGLKSWGVLV
jgi:hypothetical protein